MKILSAVVITLVAIVLWNAASLIFRNYRTLSAFGVTDWNLLFGSQKKIITIALFDAVVLVASIILHSQKKYLFNISLSIIAVLFSFIAFYL